MIKGRPVCVFEYIPGAAPALRPEIYRQLGEITGSLHRIEGYPHPYLFTVADVMPEFFELAKGLPFGRDYLDLVNTLPDFEVLPMALIHGEIIGNTLQKEDGSLIIVDWDEAGLGTRILDPGHPLIQVFLSEDRVFAQDLARAFYQGYFSKVTLTPAEIDHLFAAGLFYALRYIIYGDTPKRWRRIQFALAHKARIVSTILEGID